MSWSAATFATLPSHANITNAAFTPCVFRLHCVSISISCNAVWNAIRIHVYLQDHYACWLNRKQFFTLVNMNMNTHSVYYVYNIIKWCYSLGCKIIAAQNIFIGRDSIPFSGVYLHTHTHSLSHSTWYKIQSLNSMHICREKNEYVYIVYYQQFWFYIEWLVIYIYMPRERRRERESGLLRAAKVIASIYISTSSNREMIYRKSVLTLQMLHFTSHTISIPLSHHSLLASINFV